ncbi:MAG TPA: hypothetical protein VKY22_27055 [Bradyrhizobium sp.]|nr:hypothetical protein [Bradyrhizobium sp.]
MRRKLGLAAGALAAIACVVTTAAQAGGWRYRTDSNDGHILQYQDNGQPLFELICGRGFALFAKHPAESKTDGKARITIASGENKMSFDGEYLQPLEGAMNFRQLYLGYSRRDDAVFGPKWQKLEASLLDILAFNGPITISAGKASYQLPPIDIDKWRRPFDLCGFGYWVTPRDFPAERW